MARSCLGKSCRSTAAACSAPPSSRRPSAACQSSIPRTRKTPPSFRSGTRPTRLHLLVAGPCALHGAHGVRRRRRRGHARPPVGLVRPARLHRLVAGHGLRRRSVYHEAGRHHESRQQQQQRDDGDDGAELPLGRLVARSAPRGDRGSGGASSAAASTSSSSAPTACARANMEPNAPCPGRARRVLHLCIVRTHTLRQREHLRRHRGRRPGTTHRPR